MNLPRSQSSDNGAEKFPDAGSESHRQRAPECHSGVARRTLAPPVLPPIAPRRARKAKDGGHGRDKRTSGRYDNHEQEGMAAPTENDRADVSAACTGRGVVISEIPSSSRARAVRASFAMSC
jgi:hypothetical protein